MQRIQTWLHCWQRVKSLAKLEKLVLHDKGKSEISDLQYTRVYDVHASYYFHVQAALSSTNNQLSFRPSTSTLRVRPVCRWVDQHLPPNVHPSKNSRPYDQSLWKPLVLFQNGGMLGGGRLTSVPAAFASHRAWNQLVVWDFRVSKSWSQANDPHLTPPKRARSFHWTRIMSPGEFKQTTPRKQQISAENKWVLSDLTNNLTCANNRS